MTTGHEGDGRREFATSDQIGSLHRRASDWLKANGEFFVEPTQPITGHHENVPIAGTPPRYQYTVSGDVLRQLLPEAAATLKVGDSVELMFNVEHFSPAARDPEELIHGDPDVMIGIQKDDIDVRAEAETFFVAELLDRPADDTAARYRVELLTWLRSADGSDSADDDFVMDYGMSAAQYGALDQIVQNLDALKAAQEAAPAS